jgi:alkylation response protein AidB-like acyl-CoA dehydrogenase
VSNVPGSILGAVRDLAEGGIAADAARVDRERAFPAENLRALGEIELAGLVALLGEDRIFHTIDEAVRALGEP